MSSNNVTPNSKGQHPTYTLNDILDLLSGYRKDDKAAIHEVPLEPRPSGQTNTSTAYTPLRHDDSVSSITDDIALLETLKKNRILTIADLIHRIDNIEQLPEIGPVRANKIKSSLNERTIAPSEPLSDAQISALKNLAGSEYYYFDSLAVLCRPYHTSRTSHSTCLACSSFNDFVNRFSLDSRAVCSVVCDECQQIGYPILAPALTISLLPLVQSSLNEGSDVEAAFYEAMRTIEDSPKLIEACELLIRAEVDKWLVSANIDSTIDPLFQFPNSKPWISAINQLNEERCRAFVDEDHVKFERLSLREWLKTLRGNHHQIMELMLAGEPPKSISSQVGLSCERIEQILSDLLSKKPPLVEDKECFSLFHRYSVNRSEFIEITNSSVEVFNYCSFLDKQRAKRRTKRPLAEALHDPSFDAAKKSTISHLVDLGFANIGDQRIHLDKRSILEGILKSKQNEPPISRTELKTIYDSFLAEQGLSHNGEFSIKKTGALASSLAKWDFALQVREYVRYYDWESYDFQPLLDFLSDERFNGIECSTSILFQDESFKQIRDELDIRNHEELHVIIRRQFSGQPNIKMKKIPVISIGGGSRKTQIADLISEIGPVDTDTLASEYERRYGIDSTTFRGNYLKDFEGYRHHGIYSNQETELDSEQEAFLKGMLSESTHTSLSLTRTRFKARFPSLSPSVINSKTLKKISYKISEKLIFPANADERTTFNSLVDSHTTFSIADEGFGIDVFAHSIFRSVLSSQERSLDLVEVKKNEYWHTSLFEKLSTPITKRDLTDYTNAAVAFMRPNEPYTVKKLRDEGFKHKVGLLREELGFDDCVFSSILRASPASRALRTTNIQNCIVFSKRSGSFSAPDIIEHLLASKDAYELEDLQDIFRSDYGIDIALTELRAICKRTDAYYNENLEMVFLSTEAYGRKVIEWLY